MRVLITGAPGWLANRFLERIADSVQKGALDWRVRCLVLPGLSGTASLKSISPRIELFTGDVTHPGSLAAALDGVETVFHIAGIIHPRRLSELYDVNTRGTENLLEWSARKGVRRFVFVSSNSVAGTNLRRELLLTEEDPPRPYLNYGQSKWLAEEAVRRAHAAGKIEGVILRPCWYYGPNQPLRQTTFFKMIQKGNPIIFGDGENLRSMSYVDNTCDALFLAQAVPRAAGQTYWIADRTPYTSNEIYRTVADLLGVCRYRPRHLPDVVSDACFTADRLLQKMGLYIKEVHVAGEMNKDIACSIEKAKRELGYDPQIGLREGMKCSIEWCRRHGADL